MFAKGIAWQMLRQKALATIPDNTHIPRTSPPTITDWLVRGSFSAVHQRPKEFNLAAAHEEFAAALLTDASFHLDHAAEHSATVRNQIQSAENGTWYSGAWLTVTFYYWLFFVALGLMRMVGSSPVFLSKETVDNLHTLAGGNFNSPGAGPYILNCQGQVSISVLDVALKKAKATRVHDLLWRLVTDLIKEMSGLQGLKDDEARVFSTLEKANSILGSAWPSDLRNLVNYTPGQGYRTVRRETAIFTFSYLNCDPAITFNRALERLENNVSSLPKNAKIGSNLACAVKILVDETFLLDTISNELHREIIERRNIDRRWLNARSNFFRDKFSQYNDTNWPFAA